MTDDFDSDFGDMTDIGNDYSDTDSDFDDISDFDDAEESFSDFDDSSCGIDDTDFEIDDIEDYSFNLDDSDDYGTDDFESEGLDDMAESEDIIISSDLVTDDDFYEEAEETREESDEEYEEETEDIGLIRTNPYARDSANAALENTLEAIRDDLRDKGMEDGSEMEAIISAERARSQEEIDINLSGDLSYTHENPEYEAAVEALSHNAASMEEVSETDGSISTELEETDTDDDPEIEEMQEPIEDSDISEEAFEAEDTDEISEDTNLVEEADEIIDIMNELTPSDEINERDDMNGMEELAEQISDDSNEGVLEESETEEELSDTDAESEMEEELNDTDANSETEEETEDVADNMDEDFDALNDMITAEGLEEYLEEDNHDVEISAEMEAILKDPELATELFGSDEALYDSLENSEPEMLQEDVSEETVDETNEEAEEETAEHIELSEEEIDAVYEGLDEYDFQGVDCYENVEELDKDLQPFESGTWENLSLEEQKDSIRNLADYVIDVTGLENPPRIEYYDSAKEGDYGGYSQSDNVLYINEHMLYQNDEAADTVAHELWHAFQHERATNPTTRLDAMYAANFADYISPEDNDFVDYQSQLVESEARAFALQIKNRLKGI